MNTISPAKSGRLGYIDSMRGIAALLVVLMHNVQPIAEGWTRTLIYDVIDPGKVGVVMFFAISGFVIPFSFPKGPAPLQRFLISRFFRLYPAYWLSMAGYLLLVLVSGVELPSIATVIANVTMAQTALGQPNIIGVYWTLFIELLFYLMCALAFAGGWLQRPKFTVAASFGCLAVGALCALVRFYLERRMPVAVPLSLSIMFWGTLWREAIVNGSGEHRLYACIMLALYIAAIPVISLLAYNIDLGLEENWVRYTISYLSGIGGFIAFSTAIKITGRRFVWLGYISYSLYLFHVHARDLTRLVLSTTGMDLPVWISVPISFALAIGIAWFIFSLLEKPSIELGHRIGAVVAARRDRLRQSATMRI
ncbi:acyltransferase family protein [Inquilinus limosus]|uniref:acyltransferase family protein n=1 Tax=Inquilinus limosus TaxID=171674 RepID=UPI00068A4891|nr:acyltransferase [Inquilinus limosus]